MIRDTLEMVPVAIVLAVVLSFGVRPTHRQVPSLPSGIAGVSQAATAMLSRPASHTTGSATESDIPPGKDTSTPNTPMVQVELRIESSAPTTFMPRRTQDPEVPFFTSADLPARSRSSNTSSGTTQRTLLLPTPSTPASRTIFGSSVYKDQTFAERSVHGRRKIGINRAQIEDLVRIPGIGRSRAEMIVSQRPAKGYSAWEQIDALPGFGPGTIGMLMQHAELDGFPAGEDRRNP